MVTASTAHKLQNLCRLSSYSIVGRLLITLKLKGRCKTKSAESPQKDTLRSFLSLYIFLKVSLKKKIVSLYADVNINKILLHSPPALLEVTNDSSMAAAAAKLTTSSQKDAH